MEEQAHGPEVRRDGLLERLERVRPTLVALIAPAGFGKSTLVRQLLGKRGGYAICDCAGVTDDLDLARRLIPALAIESPDRVTSLTQRELMLGDGGTSISERVRLALEAWREPTDGTTFAFENAEHLAHCPPARDFFARLLAQRPPGRSIVLCSRESLRLHLTRFAPPHEIMVLRATDLAFDRDEIRSIFGAHVEDDATLDRILAVSQGWPIAIFLVKRFAAEGRMEKLLSRLDDVAFEELHDYLVDEVLSSLDQRTVDALFAAASIPRATPLDVSFALDDPAIADEIAEFAKESPFAARNADGTLAVHPLLASLLLEHREEKRNALLSSVADRYEAQEAYVRAAELHLARGDQMAAARTLGRHEVIRDHSPSMEYASVLSSLDRSLVRTYPRLWGVTAMLRLFCVDTEEMLEEAESIYRTLPPETSPIERYYIFVFRVLFMSYLGMFEEALEMIDGFAKANNVPEEPRSLLDGYVAYVRALLTARLGRLDESEKQLMLALPLIQAMDVMASGTLLTLGADIARVRGERAMERQFIDRAIEHARRSVLSNFVAFDLTEAVIGAWLAGEEETAARYAVELEEHVERLGIRGFAYIAAVARGRAAEPTEVDLLKYVAVGRLMACGDATDAQDAARLARSALIAAELYRAPFTECLAAAATALFDAAAFDEYMERARSCARRCDSPALQSAVEAIAGRTGEYGMLDAFVAKLSRERERRVPPLEIELTTGKVASNGVAVALSDRELELLVALSLRRETVPRGRLADLIWPELEEYAARNALSVCLHRLRAHLGNDGAIVRSGEGYRLHDEAWVDLWEIDRLVAAIRARGTVGDVEREALRESYARLREPRPVRMQSWEWFEHTERHIGELRLEVAMRLATDALARDGAQDALGLAHEMIAYDPCDEPAREIAIRAYLLLGDRAAAMRHFRQYRETLQSELQCDPSPSLVALVGSGA
jgi:DNA-binding SARP family transcriptional activator